jgi:hypothetical protein
VPSACQSPVKFGLPFDIRGIRGAAFCPAAGSTQRKTAAQAAAIMIEDLIQSRIGKSANQHIISTPIRRTGQVYPKQIATLLALDTLG